MGPPDTKELLSNAYGMRRQCINSIQEAEARGHWAKAQKYRNQLGMLNSLIRSAGVGKDSWTAADGEDTPMRLSARNQLPGTVVEVHLGAVNATVKVDVGSGNVITSSVPNEAVEELGVTVGDEVTAIFNAFDVIIGK